MMIRNGLTNTYTLGIGNRLESRESQRENPGQGQGRGKGNLTPHVQTRTSTIRHDDAGNVTRIHYKDETPSRLLDIEWNERYQITAVYTNDALAEKYGYDAIGRRVWISDGSTTNYLVYDGIHVVAEVDASGTLQKSYTYGPDSTGSRQAGVDNLLVMSVYTNSGGTTAVSSVFFYVKDHLGSVIAIVDETGTNVVERYEYDAWGNVTAYDGDDVEIDESQIGNRYLWQGREYSWATGLYNFRARWYEAEIGRWLSKDPIGISGGLNQYVFCGNNPVNARDPLGLCEEDKKIIFGLFPDLVQWLEDNGHRPKGGNRNNILFYWDCTEQADWADKQFNTWMKELLRGKWSAVTVGHNWRVKIGQEYHRVSPHHWVEIMSNDNPRQPTIILDTWSGRIFERSESMSPELQKIYGTEPHPATLRSQFGTKRHFPSTKARDLTGSLSVRGSSPDRLIRPWPNGRIFAQIRFAKAVVQ